MTKTTKVCLCGGGNGIHVSAAYIGSKFGYKVYVLTRKPEMWNEGMKEHGGVLCHAKRRETNESYDVIGKVTATANPSDVKDCDIFILGGPAHANPLYLEKIAPYVKKGAIIGTLFAQGGFDWAAKHAIGSQRLKDLNIKVFGLSHIPWTCKLSQYGKECRMLGVKKYLQVAVSPISCCDQVLKIVEQVYDIPCKKIPNFLSLTMTPSNQIIHPGRFYGLFKDWDGKKVYHEKDIPLLYEGMDDFSAKQLQSLSDELLRVKKAIISKYPQLDLSVVKDLGQRICEQYGSSVADKRSLKTIFATNKAYAGLKAPLKELGDGKVIPNPECRFFVEDIPYGLCVLRDIGNIAGIETPIFDHFIQWHQQFMPNKYLVDSDLTDYALQNSGAPSRYGITSLDELVESNL